MLNIPLLIFLFVFAMGILSIINASTQHKSYAFMAFLVIFILFLFINDNYEKPLKYE